MSIITEQKVSPKGKLNIEDLKGWGMNFLKFVAPTFIIFFSLLAQGVSIEKAYPLALFGFYQSLVDILTKLNTGK
ncbi:hypothetical protein M0R04_16085 [Candidatus Dojkabacteria bacterium]|jgi:hypothetical protein|nr:hypothetical protein [Candidatus Dojkabacteria bacterium]